MTSFGVVCSAITQAKKQTFIIPIGIVACYRKRKVFFVLLAFLKYHCLGASRGTAAVDNSQTYARPEIARLQGNMGEASKRDLQGWSGRS